MKISMHIIARWMRAYAPVATILDGKMELEGVRMFSSTTPPSTRYVYVARNSDLFGSNDHEVLLIHRNDVIQLPTENLEDVFNNVVEAFEYYRNLEYRLTLAVHLEQPEQKIIDICREQFGVAYIMNQKYHILAISAPRDEGDYSSPWRAMQETRLISLDRLNEMRDVAFYKNINRKVHNLVFPSPLTTPFCHGVMNSYCDHNGRIIGQCMIGFQREIQQADLQLIDVVMEFLNNIENKTELDNGNYMAEMLFDAMIHKRGYEDADLLKVTHMQKWSEDTVFCIFSCVILDPHSGTAYDHAHLLTGLQQNIYRRHPKAICVIDHSLLTCCLPVKPDKVEELTVFLSRQVPDLRPGENLRTGVSYFFQDFTDSPYYFEQSMAAVRYAQKHRLPCSSIHSCALDTCVLHPVAGFILRCLHPLVQMLKEADSRDGTCYYETLRCFLRSERSYVDTAKQLNVHRNTIVYRMERILELYPILELDDPDEREYLLFSCRFDGQQK